MQQAAEQGDAILDVQGGGEESGQRWQCGSAAVRGADEQLGHCQGSWLHEGRGGGPAARN